MDRRCASMEARGSRTRLVLALIAWAAIAIGFVVGFAEGVARASEPRETVARSSRDGTPSERRVRVGDGKGGSIVARVYGSPESRVVLLPDGRLGFSSALVKTEAAFEPMTIGSLRERLSAGEFQGFDVVETKHYLVFYQGSRSFAESSAKLLETLLAGMSRWLRQAGFPVRAPEFPLVAVVYRNEREFRASGNVDPNVQAYYDVLSNRIAFYEHRDRELEPPDVVLRRRPQTVAHEGTHQILQNIGVQPRLAKWPLWLSEGLAEFCAPTGTIDGGWAGANWVNDFHLSTLRDMAETSGVMNGGGPVWMPLAPRRTAIEELLSRERFEPTDYARSWSLVHYLANQHQARFVLYLRRMGRMDPLVGRRREESLREFRDSFTANLPRLNQHFAEYIGTLAPVNPMPETYYSVLFEQRLVDGSVRSGVLVSPSVAVVQEWIEGMRSSEGGPAMIEVSAWERRSQAVDAAGWWLENRAGRVR